MSPLFQVAGLAVALRAKGETAGEIAGLVEAMLANATQVELPEDVRTNAVDVVGTGGDRANTVNISTMAAIVVAAAGMIALSLLGVVVGLLGLAIKIAVIGGVIYLAWLIVRKLVHTV